jgi:glycine cleavage system H protein
MNQASAMLNKGGIMANIIDGVKYTKEHEWVKVEGDTAIEGLTDYAQSELSDIVMVELPAVGKKIKAGDAIGTIEAVKAVSDLYAGLSGEITEVNEKVVSDPALINKDPYGEAWLYKIKIDDPKEVDNLLSPEQYKELIEKH